MVNELMRLIAEHDSEVGAAVNAEFARHETETESGADRVREYRF